MICQGKIAAAFETSLVLWTSPTAYTENHPVKSAFKNIVFLRFSPPGFGCETPYIITALNMRNEKRETTFQKRIHISKGKYHRNNNLY